MTYIIPGSLPPSYEESEIQSPVANSENGSGSGKPPHLNDSGLSKGTESAQLSDSDSNVTTESESDSETGSITKWSTSSFASLLDSSSYVEPSKLKTLFYENGSLKLAGSQRVRFRGFNDVTVPSTQTKDKFKTGGEEVLRETPLGLTSSIHPSTVTGGFMQQGRQLDQGIKLSRHEEKRLRKDQRKESRMIMKIERLHLRNAQKQNKDEARRQKKIDRRNRKIQKRMRKQGLECIITDEGFYFWRANEMRISR